MGLFRYYLVLDEDEDRIATFDMGLEDELIEFIKNNPEAVYLDIKEQNSQETGLSKKPKYAYYLFWERDVDPIEKLDRLRPVKSALDEKLVMKDPKDRRKHVTVPESIKNVINNPEFQKVKDICKEYYDGRGIERYYEPEKHTFRYLFTFDSKYGYPDKKFLEEFYKRFGFNDLKKLETHQNGYGHSEYEGFLTIGDCNVRIDTSSGFKIYSINIIDDKTEIMEDIIVGGKKYTPNLNYLPGDIIIPKNDMHINVRGKNQNVIVCVIKSVSGCRIAYEPVYDIMYITDDMVKAGKVMDYMYLYNYAPSEKYIHQKTIDDDFYKSEEEDLNKVITDISKTEIIESLEEDIEKHDTLNPKLFDGEKLKPEVKDTIENVVEVFIQELEEEGIRFDLKDILLIGSNVNYNYTKDSDLDVHIIADSTHLDCPHNLYPLLYSAYRSMFNKNYDITIKGIPLELYVEMDEPGGKSNGIYSLKTGWVKRPVQKDIPDLDREAFDKLFKEWEDRYFDLIGNQEILTEAKSDDIYDFIEDLYNLRKESIASEGEFGLGNLVFKEFRNLGYLDNLKELRKTEKGKELSLEKLEEGTNEAA